MTPPSILRSALAIAMACASISRAETRNPHPAPGAALAHPAIPGTPISTVYQVRVDGVPVPVNDESALDFHTAFFSMGKPVMVEIEFSEGVSFSSIHPLRHGIRPRVTGHTISFPMTKPQKLVIKAAGSLPLALCATPMETDVPAPNSPNVRYFGPGVHEPGLIEPVSGQTIYLAAGALVKGRIETRKATGVSIRGRGTLDARGFSINADKTHAVLFERCKEVRIEGIGIRGGSWWQTLFLLTDDASATHLSLLGKSVNTDGIDIDGVQRFVARDCFIRCEDDGFGWHALDAKANGEPPTRDCLAEDCVIWNTRAGNGLRVGASMETSLFENITFRNIDVLEHANAAICSDHSDWATCRNIRFENFIDETKKKTVEIIISKTRYTNANGYRNARGNYDGLVFDHLISPGGGIKLHGFDASHRIENVIFKDSYIRGSAVDAPDDITTNAFVSNVTFAVKPPEKRLDVSPILVSQPGWMSIVFSSVPMRSYTIVASDGPGKSQAMVPVATIQGSTNTTSIVFHDPANIVNPKRVFQVHEK